MTQIVLGIDGLEPRKVYEYKLDQFKLSNHAETNLEDFPVIVTPPLWGSILTGEIREDLMKPFEKRKKRKELLPIKVAKKVLPLKWRRKLGEATGIWGWIQGKNRENPMDKAENLLNKNETILGELNSWDNGVPPMRNPRRPEWKDLRNQAIKGETEPYEEKILEMFKEDKRELLDALNNKNDYELIFWYTQFIDLSGHIFFKNNLKTMNHYIKAHELVKNVEELIDEEDELIIISDHGFTVDEYGVPIHSEHGFFSSNNGKLIEKPQDLYYLLKEGMSY